MSAAGLLQEPRKKMRKTVIGLLLKLVKFASPVRWRLVAFVVIIGMVLFLMTHRPSYTNPAICLINLTAIESGKQQAALAVHWRDDADCDTPSNRAIVNMYLKGNTTPICPDGGTYSYGSLDQLPACSKYRADNDAATRFHHLPTSR